MSATWCVALGAILACACSNTSSEPEVADAASEAATTTRPWRAALYELTTRPTTLYSFSFDGAPPAGERLSFGLHLADRSEACARYDGTASSTDFWYLDIELNHADAGPYPVTTDRLSSHADPVANVTLLHRGGGKYVERYPALSGSLLLATSPDPDKFLGGATSSFVADLSFAAHAVQALECAGGIGPNGPAAPTSCTCQDDDGNKTTCLLAAGHEQCCFDAGGEEFSVHLDLTALPCGAMCREVSGLPDYCAESRQP